MQISYHSGLYEDYSVQLSGARVEKFEYNIVKAVCIDLHNVFLSNAGSGNIKSADGEYIYF